MTKDSIMKLNNLPSNGILILLIFITLNARFIYADDATTTTTTLEPEAVTGCAPPDFKVSRSKGKMATTEQPFVTFETTTLYLPQDFTSHDLEFVDGKAKDKTGSIVSEQIDKNTQKDASNVKENPYWFEDWIVKDAEPHYHSESNVHHQHHHHHNTRRAKRNHYRKLKTIHGISNSMRLNERILAKRSVDYQDDEIIMPDEVLSPSDVIENIFNANDTIQGNINGLTGNRDVDSDLYDLEDILEELRELEANNKFHEGDIISKSSKTRVKRKSAGKTTSALNRPKSSSDSKKTSTGRKTHGTIDDDGQFQIDDSDEERVQSKETDKDSDEVEEPPEQGQFREVSEVRFPAEVGPLGTHRNCKIKCIDGMWQGPLCAVLEQDEGGQIKYEPLYKRCVVDGIPQHLLLSYKNVSVTLNWDLPHGHTLQARCADLGLYKLVGEAKVLCSNGLWAPKLPQCVPTTLLTNYSDDSPPSIRIKVGVGSASYEPSGMLAVLPGSTLHLDCMYPRKKGSPEWTWTGWFRQYLTGWSAVPEEKASRYRLSIKDVQMQDSGTYTCASPRGLTNSITIVVAVSQCPTMSEPSLPLSLRLEGIKLGQRAIYRCQMGYILQGNANLTCLASGNWSSPPPSCIPIQCPPLFLEDPHLSLIELNTSAWGRAVFSCSWGYKLSGPSTLECLASGHWSQAVPRCRAIQCPQPLIPLNGKIDSTSGVFPGQRKYAVGALLTFSCNEGHVLQGETSIVCSETGFWSNIPPICKYCTA
ncbi:hypothetical protein ACKWTF_002641 [Chironomus riparius]